MRSIGMVFCNQQPLPNTAALFTTHQEASLLAISLMSDISRSSLEPVNQRAIGYCGVASRFSWGTSMRIAQIAKIGSAAIIGGLLTLAFAGWQMLDEVKVGGPHYQRIVLGKDLLADILPPPEYIVEPFLEATLALGDPQHAKATSERMAALRKDYDTRHAFWLKQELPKDLAQVFLLEAHGAAARFWGISESEFFPALFSGDTAKAQEAHGKLRAAYGEHRAKIDQTIAASTSMVQDIEVAAASRVSHTLTLATGVTLAVLAAMLAATISALKGVVAPIAETASAMRQLAGGNMAVSFPGQGRKDEIGDMAAAAEVFRENALARTALEQEQHDLLQQEHERRVHLEHVLENFEARMEQINKAHLASSQAASRPADLVTVGIAAGTQSVRKPKR